MSMNEKKYFTCFNKDEAEEYIGKRCRCSDHGSRLLSGEGEVGTLIRIKDNEDNDEYPFVLKNNDTVIYAEECFRFCTPVEKKLRPYESFEEMVKDAMVHGLDGKYFKIRDKGVYMRRVALVSEGAVDYTFAAKKDEFISFNELAEKYTWHDGTPCGIEEEV